MTSRSQTGRHAKGRRGRFGTAGLALAIALAALAAGCGEKSENTTPGAPQRFTVELDWIANADHAGIYEGIDGGFFDEAGLDVRPQVPSDPSSPIKQVATGQVDLAVSYEPEVLLAHDQGLPVKAVAALVPQPLTSLIWLPDSGIRSVADLKGKTIATAGIPYQDAYLQAILGQENLSTGDVNEVNVQQGLLPAILSGKADAILGGFLNIEGVDLSERGKNPIVTPVDRLGIPPYDELVLVANSDTLGDDSDAIRRFLGALERGTEAAVKDPAAATDAILKASRGLDPKLTRAEVDRTLPLLAPPGGDTPYGYMDPKQWQRFAQFFADQSVIRETPSTEDVLTNDLLPGNIP
jgi:putative hydroxymethylpyrimidine transport system substrate-binding protein